MYELFRSSIITAFRKKAVTTPTAVLSMVLVVAVLAGNTSASSAYGSNPFNLNNSATAPVTTPTAESVYQSESMELPPSIGSFIILIANEAHESWQDERQVNY